MKLICLNIQGGNLYEPLLKFMENRAADTDVFCFQEVFDTTADAPPLLSRGARATIYGDIARRLGDFEGYFAQTFEGRDWDKPVSFPLRQGLATFVKKTIPVQAVSAKAILAGYDAAGQNIWSVLPRTLQLVTVASPNGPLTIASIHGLLDDGGKWDTPARLAQFEAVRDSLATIPHAKIFCGDLNVRQDTDSVRMFERAGMRDIIKEFGVPSTRNHHYAGLTQFNDPISDYVFVSPDVNVRTCAALPDEISDHLAIAVEWS